MSIVTIPNQPVNLTGSTLQGCLCDPLVPSTLIADSDFIEVCFRAYACADSPLLFQSTTYTTNWKDSGNWQLSEEGICVTGAGDYSSILEEISFTPIFNERYELRLNFSLLIGTMNVTIGGFQAFISSPGVHFFVFTATGTNGIEISPVTEETLACLFFNGVNLYEANNDLTVTMYDDQGVQVFQTDWDTDPQWFTFVNDWVVLSIPMDETGVTGCFYLNVSDCDVPAGFDSQVFQVITNTDCTLLFRACNDNDALGFPSLFTPMLRAMAKLVRPTWQFDVSEERRSNGRNMRHYIDRQTIYDLRIDLQNEYAMPFVAAFPVFNHFYIGQQEYFIDADEVSPTYSDIFDATGGVEMKVRPKQELFRNVMCGEENTAGCVPPPNFLVQRRGPNEDYVTLQTGDRIALH